MHLIFLFCLIHSIQSRNIMVPNKVTVNKLNAEKVELDPQNEYKSYEHDNYYEEDFDQNSPEIKNDKFGSNMLDEPEANSAESTRAAIDIGIQDQGGDESEGKSGKTRGISCCNRGYTHDAIVG